MLSKIKYLIVMAALTLITVSPALAEELPVWLNPVTPLLTTDSTTNTLPITNFSSSETPYSYISFNSSDVLGAGSLEISWYWIYDHTDIRSFYVENHLIPSSGLIEIWSTPSDWGTISEQGDWTVGAIWGADKTATTPEFNGYGSSEFTVTPEPISVALFCIGAVPFALSLRKKNPLV